MWDSVLLQMSGQRLVTLKPRGTVNTRYRHTLGTPKMYACNVAMSVMRQSRYIRVVGTKWLLGVPVTWYASANNEDDLAGERWYTENVCL